MLLNLTDILSNEGKTQEISVSFSQPFYKKDKAQFKVLKNDEFVLKLQNVSKGKLCISGEGEMQLQARCDRCLQRADVTVAFSIDEEISEELILNPTDADEYPYLNGYELDTDILIGNELLINWPVKILCKEDCKGICPNCGKDLNQGDCGCDTFVPDPRLAVLKDIFIANKEV